MVSCLKSYEFLSKKYRHRVANDFSVGESYLAGWHGNRKKHHPRCMLYLRLKSLSVYWNYDWKCYWQLLFKPLIQYERVESIIFGK